MKDIQWKNIIFPAIFAAFLVGISSYVSQSDDFVLSGIILSIPISMASLLFFSSDNHSDYKTILEYFICGLIVYVLAASLFYYLYTRKMTFNKALIISLVFWIIVMFMIYIKGRI